MMEKKDYENYQKLSPEEKIWYAEFIDTELTRTKHPDYSPKQMKEVYNACNASDRDLMSNQHRTDAPSVVYDGEVISHGKGYDEIMLDIKNIQQVEPDEFKSLWRKDFSIAYDQLMSEYIEKPLSTASLMNFYVRINQLLRWERLDRSKND